jgi:hypothetical protein
LATLRGADFSVFRRYIASVLLRYGDVFFRTFDVDLPGRRQHIANSGMQTFKHEADLAI